MRRIAVQSGPNRPRQTLQLLADAGEAGLTTTQIVEGLGTGKPGLMQQPLSWAGSDLRRAEAHGWVTRIGTGKGARQMTIRWRITPGGIERLHEYESARAQPTTRQVAADRKARADQRVQVRQGVLAAAKAIGPEDLSDERKQELVQQLRDAGCTYQEIGDVFGCTREWIRLVLYYGTWHVTEEMMIGRKEAKALIAHTRLSQELEEASYDQEDGGQSGAPQEDVRGR